MKIAVLIKQVPDTAEERMLDPDTGRMDREASDAVIDEITERALELALTRQGPGQVHRGRGRDHGPGEAAKSIRKALSMGADSGIHVLDDSLAGADLVLTAADAGRRAARHRGGPGHRRQRIHRRPRPEWSRP